MVRVSRFVYLFAAWLFVTGVTVQVFLAGMTVVALKMSWNNHISLGHILAGPLLVMLISLYTGRLPGTIKRMNWALFLVYVLQADVLIFLRAEAPVLSALHPVMALFDFALGLFLARSAWAQVRQVQAIPAAIPEPNPFSST